MTNRNEIFKDKGLVPVRFFRIHMNNHVKAICSIDFSRGPLPDPILPSPGLETKLNLKQSF